ncbi:hypothetical protein BES34_018420 [Leptospira inadai serovar Lyme]|uniref:Lipoprotein n=1 Tax=Leptospira inadai serovar Lyme TaxID=293084 RepID=A0ABX4YE43_9LEPT|nr:hypothetical protein BES34_018420 [Leptospira inadai serovar Lyme]
MFFSKSFRVSQFFFDRKNEMRETENMACLGLFRFRYGTCAGKSMDSRSRREIRINDGIEQSKGNSIRTFFPRRNDTLVRGYRKSIRFFF